MVDLNLPTPGQAPNWAPQLNNEIEKLNAEVEKVPELYDTGFDLLILAGQSLALGTGAIPESWDVDADWIRYWGVTPGGRGFHELNTITSLPLDGGLLEPRPYGLFGGLSTARLMRDASARPVVIVPVAAGGAGFYSHNTVAGRWLVDETLYANLASIALEEINLAIAAAVKQFGPARKAVVIWNQGEADRDVGVTESQYAAALDDLISYFRSGVNLRDGETLPWIISRQLPERRSVDGEPGRGVDLAQVDTPTRVPYTAVVNPPLGHANADNTHSNAAGQRKLGLLYYEALGRAETNRPSLAPTPVRNLRLDGDRLTWDAPEVGRTSLLRIRARIKGTGHWTGLAAVPAGTSEYSIAGQFTTGTPVEVSVETSGPSGNSDLATVEGVMPAYTPGLQFLFDADTLDNIRDTTVRPGVWRSSHGMTPDLGMGLVSGSQPLIEYNANRLNGHKSVMLTGGSTLATDDNRLNINQFTFAMLIQPHTGDSTNLSQLLAGSNQSFRVLYRPSDRRIGYVVNEGASIGVDAPTGWIVVVIRNTGSLATVDVESVGGARVTASGAATGAPLIGRVSLSSSYGGNLVNANYQSVRGHDQALSDSGVTGLIDMMFKEKGLR